VQEDPKDDDAHRILTVILARLGQSEPAIEEARKAAALGPENPSAARLIVTLLARAGQDGEAIAAARTGLAAFPYDADLHYSLSQALAREGDWAAAARQINYALLFRPDWTEARLTRDQIISHLKNPIGP